MSRSKFYSVSWQKLHQACFQTAKKILAQKMSFDRIVAISRGGLVVARIFSDYLDLPISPFTIVAYTAINQKGKARVVEDLKVAISQETILLIDEVADTGDTFKLALKYLQKFRPRKVYTLAPFIKTWTKYKPDFWQVKTDKWIIFPYDVRETVVELKNKVSLEKLQSLGLVKEQIDYFIKIDKMR